VLAGSVWYMYGTHVYGLFDMLEFKLCCEILLPLNMVDMCSVCVDFLMFLLVHVLCTCDVM